MATVESLLVEIKADTKKLRAEIKTANDSLKKIEKTSNRVTKNMALSFKRLGGVISAVTFVRLT